MSSTPDYQEAHLVVAGVRVRQHLDGHPPTPEAVAQTIGVSVEKVFLVVRALRQRGVLTATETPFEMRLDVLDPTPLEQLPRDAKSSEFKGELDQFHEREREKQAEMQRMFLGGEAEKRRQDRVQKLEDEFKKFKPRGGPAGLFKEPSPDDE